MRTPCAFLLALCVGASLLSARPFPSDEGAPGWPQYNGPASDRISRETLDRSRWPEAAKAPVWQKAMRDGFSSFSIGRGRAYTLVERREEGANREACIALDLESGEVVWERLLGGAKYDGGGDAGASENNGGDGPRSTPSHDGERVYVYDSALGLYCLDDETGDVVWSHEVRDAFDGRQIQWQNASSPLVEGDLVLVAGGGPGQSLLAFDKEKGELAWKTGDETMTHATPIVATVHGVRQVIFYMQSGLVSVLPKTGELLWKIEYPFRVSSAASPIVHEDIVYCSAGYGVGAGAFRLVRDGETWSHEFLWRDRKLQNHWSTPVCIDGHLYGMFSFKKYGEGPLACVDLRTGETRWSQEGYGPGNCILVGDTLVALSDAGEVVLVEPTAEAYRELSRADVLDGKCWSTPVFAGGKLLVRSTKEGACFELGSKRTH